MKRNTAQSTQNIVIAAMLSAIGIVIPMFSPIKVILEPASFTLASHVPIFLAMFISPLIAFCVSIGTTIGFFFGGFSPIIVLRAFSHVIFATIGALIIKKFPSVMQNKISKIIFCICISILHAIPEILVSAFFYFDGKIGVSITDDTFITSVLLLVGVGTFVHSMVDFGISRFVWAPVKKVMPSANYTSKSCENAS